MILAHEQVLTEWYFFSLKIQMVHAKMNLYFNLPVYSLISMQNIKMKISTINDYCLLHIHISIKK